MAELKYTPEEIQLIKRVKLNNLEKDEFELAIYRSEKSGLNYLKNQMYAQVYISKKTGARTLTFITGIDGYRLIAGRTGELAGSDDPVVVFDDARTKPLKSTVTVHRLVHGVSCAFTATAYYMEYYPAFNTAMWDKMPVTMISKCAEALALRKAFPDELEGMVTQEEMDQATGEKDFTPPAAKTRAWENDTQIAKTPEGGIVVGQVADGVAGAGEVKAAIASAAPPAQQTSGPTSALEMVYPYKGRHAGKKLKDLSRIELQACVDFCTSNGNRVPAGVMLALYDNCQAILNNYPEVSQ